MAFSSSRSVRFQDDHESPKSQLSKTNSKSLKYAYNREGSRRSDFRSQAFPEKTSKTLKQKVLSRVFSEDYDLENVEKRFFDPRGRVIHIWNKIFLVACLVSLFVDPLLFYLPGARDTDCLYVSDSLEDSLTTIRTIADLFYMLQIFVRFRTAYVAPSSRVFGTGELVIDPSMIASRYLSGGFWLDLIAALPIPQFMIWVVFPNLKGITTSNTKNLLRLCVIFQYLVRLFLIFPLSSQIVKMSGVLTETAWAGAAYNLMLYMLASHVLGACWYLLAMEREQACWKEACQHEIPYCQYEFFDCRWIDKSRDNWFQNSNLTELCNPRNNFYQFGIYADAASDNILTLPFFQKYFYCFWWGLKNLSSLGQNLNTSTFVGEIVFAIIIAVLGLVLFGLLIGNMQSCLQSTTTRIEEWRVRRSDTERWMRHRQLPQELRECVRRYDQYRWVATRGVNEEQLLKGLPLDLRRDIKRHLCLDLVRRVPLFDQMDEQMLDAICERLRPALYTTGTYLVREMDPVNEMIFIIRGHLESSTTNGGRTGFFNACRISSGDFCGEELLTWAVDPRPSGRLLPSSTRTVKAFTEVEAFALVAVDIKFVAAQFRRLHSKQLRSTFRFYSHQWRSWAACSIQAAWRRHKRRQSSIELKRAMESKKAAATGTATAVSVAKLAASVRQGGDLKGKGGNFKKPEEPDFSIDEES